MNIFLIHKIIIVLIGVFGLSLGSWILFIDRRNKINQAFFFLVLSYIVWIIEYYFFISSPPQSERAFFIAKSAVAVVSLFYIPYYLFFIYFLRLEQKYKLLNKIVVIWCFFLAGIALFTNLLVEGVKIEKWGNNLIFGKLSALFFGTALFLSVVVIYSLLKQYLFINRERERIKYFLVGVLIWILMNFFFNMIPGLLGSIRYSYMGNYSAIFLLGFIGYAIVAHRLFDIKIVLTEVLVSIFAIFLFAQIFLSDTIFDYVKNIFTFIAFVVIGYFLIKEFFHGVETYKTIDRLEKQLLQKELDTQMRIKADIIRDSGERVQNLWNRFFNWEQKDQFLENLKFRKEIFTLRFKVKELERELEKRKKRK